jgi:hypothetical protein
LRHPSSFRDPSGYIAEIDGEIYRFIHPDAQENFAKYIDSGLHTELIGAGLIVDHQDLGLNFALAPHGWQTIKPNRIDRISYASEWCFSQLRDAGLLTLEIQIRALKKGFSLKDASSYNVQFDGAKPIFIDTLSLEPSKGDESWLAYRQFCEHFLAPLALMSYCKPDIYKLWNAQIDGATISLASSLLPVKSWMNFGVTAHIHLHALSGSKVSDGANKNNAKPRILQDFQLNLANSLKKTLLSISETKNHSNWSNYRQDNTYQGSDAHSKLKFIQEVAVEISAKTILDLGSNDGHYSKELSKIGLTCTAAENDLECCEFLYKNTKKDQSLERLLGLHIDLCNPTPNYGWALSERASFTSRYKCDLVLALALIHHLSIGQNVPYDRVASYLAELSENLIVEYIPPADVMSQKLLSSRIELQSNAESLFGLKSFEDHFTSYFDIVKKSSEIAGGRILYQMKLKINEPN